MKTFGDRHRDLPDSGRRTSSRLEHRLVGAGDLSSARRQLIGAYFTQEYAIEGAALFNPSLVRAP